MQVHGRTSLRDTKYSQAVPSSACPRPSRWLGGLCRWPTCFSGLATTAFIYNIIHCYEWTSSGHIRQGQNAMQNVRTCCCEQYAKCGGLWGSPSAAFACLILLRGAGGLVATAAFMVPVFDDATIRLLWRVSVSLWLVSCAPGIVCLVQCAAYAKDKHVKFLKHFRSQLALRLMHDVMLGIFWLYLALRIDDVLGGAPKRRTGMAHDFHVHVVVAPCCRTHARHLFSKTTRFITSGCCDESNAHLWIKSMRILAIVGLYAVVIHRVNDDARPLGDMGSTGVNSH